MTRLLFVSLLGLVIGIIPGRVSTQPFDTCVGEGRAALDNATVDVRLDNEFAPSGPGEVVTVHGSRFDALPTEGLAIRVGGSSSDGQSIYCWVPAEVDGPEALHFVLPADGLSDQVCQHGNTRYNGNAPRGQRVQPIPVGRALTTVDMELRLDGLLPPDHFAVHGLDLMYLPAFPNLDCGVEIRHPGGIVFGTQIPADPFPAPLWVRPLHARSDTVGFLEWRYLTGTGGHDIDGFRVYQHWCQRGPGEDCSYESRPAYEIGLDGSATPGGMPFWYELTCDWSGLPVRQQAGRCPDANRIQPLPSGVRREPYVANLAASPPSLVRSRVFFAMTAWSRTGGESPPGIGHIDFPDNYGCTGRVQAPRSTGMVTGEIQHFTGENDAGGFPVLTPFWGDTEALPVDYLGEAIALVDVKRYPIVEFYNTGDARILPFAHDASGGPRVLSPSRGYGSSMANGLANIVVDGRFSDPSGQHPYYVAAHIRANLQDPQPGAALPVALLAGQELANTEYAVGMVPDPGAALTLELQVLELPDAQGAGRIAGTMTGTLVDILTTPPPLPGEIPPGQQNREIWTFKNEVSLTFDLPLHDDACR